MDGIIRVSLLLLSFTFLVIDLQFGFAALINPTSRSTEFIKISCRSTSYPTICFSSLAGQDSSIQTSPCLMAQAALSMNLNGARSTSATMSKLSTGSSLKPREIVAMKDCIKNIRYSVDEIRQFVGEMGKLSGKGFGLHINNIQTWLSVALTNEDTCMDSFADNAMNGNLKNGVRAKIVNMAQMTSNALALVNALAPTQGRLH